MKKVVVIGGGSGLATLLRGLKKYPLDIAAIVTMTDNGTSSGRLRREVGILPPGDIRKCLAALAENESELLELFNHRFKRGFGIAGHSMGNLLIAALQDTTGSFEKAIEKASGLLKIKGQVIPATLQSVHLGAEFEDGRKVVGEVEVCKRGYTSKIERVFLSGKSQANQNALKAIQSANIILVGPGSLYSSVIPNFLHQEILDEYNKSKARKIYICNVSTERGETEKFKASDHIKALKIHGINCDTVLLNSKMFPKGSGDGYVDPVEVDLDKNIKMAALSDVKNPLYHDPKKLADAIFDIIKK